MVRCRLGTGEGAGLVDYLSDKLVLDFLGSVGDVAQRRLRPEDRARLVERLRSQINSERERVAGDSPGAVQAVLDRLGTPETIVAAEMYRAPDYTDYGDDTGEELPEDDIATLSGRRSRYATKARQIGFHADGSPMLPPGVTATVPEARTAAPAGPNPPTTREESLWWRSPPAGAQTDDGGRPISLGSDSVMAPAIPVDVAPEPPSDLDDGEESAAGTDPVWVGVRARVREWLALAVLLVGVGASSPVIMVVGFVAVFAGHGWTVAEKRIACIAVPGAVLLVFAVGMVARANGMWGHDLTQAEAGRHYGDLMFPLMAQIAALVAALYLVWAMLRARAAD